MNFIKRTLLEIKKGGINTAIKKFVTFLLLLLSSPIYIISIVFLPIIYLLQPIYLIRIGNLSSSRLGHFAANTELYLCERDAKINITKNKFLDIFFLQDISNKQLEKMWKRKIIIMPSFFLKPIYSINKFLSNFFSISKKHLILNTMSDRDVNNLLDCSKPHLEFTEKEKAEGENFLREMNIPKNSKYVCLIVRDNAFLNDVYPEKNWDYHSYRNYNIEKFIDAAEILTKRGYYVFRMGAKVEKKLKSSNKKIIDYANLSVRSDFLDVYLGAHCNFCVTTSCGFDAIPFIFRIPIAYITVPIQYFFTFSNKFLIMSKHHFSKKLRRNLKFSEIIFNKIGKCDTKKKFDLHEISLEENSSSEIKDFVVEMIDRQENKWKEDENDKIMQDKFWKNYEYFLSQDNIKYLHVELKAKLSINFLKKNPEWLM